MARVKKERHPPGLYVLFGTEAAERFSFYTMRALLVLYLTTIILPVIFRESSSYRGDLDKALLDRPAATFADITRDITNSQGERLKEALRTLDPKYADLNGDELVQAQAAYFAEAVERHRGQMGAIVTQAFTSDRLRAGEDQQETLFGGAVDSLAVDQRGFVDWVVSLKIKRDIRDRALSVYGLYLLLVYLSGLLGGAISDKILGSRKAILAGGLVMCAGLFTMWYPSLIFYGLGLIIAGNGFFKPNISTIVSGLYPEGDKRRDPAFTIFYMGINLGALLAIFGAGFAEGLAGEHSWGWNVGFVIAAVGMILSLALFLWGQKHLGTAGFPPGREVTPESRLLGSDFRDIAIWAVGMIVVVLCFFALWNQFGSYWSALPWLVKLIIGAALVVATIFGVRGRNNPNVAEAKPFTREEWQQVAVIAILSVFVIFFWAGFEQAGGTMNLFAYEQTDRHIGGWEMPATWFQGFNPLFIILLAPVFSMIWGWNDKKSWGLSTPGKMGLGMIILGLGFVLMYFGQQVADEQGKASLLFLVGVYLLHSLGELCLSPIGLSMVTRLSPVRIVSLMMGVWFACTAVADYLSGQLERITHEFGIDLWLVLISSSFGAGVVLLILTPLLKKWMHGKA